MSARIYTRSGDKGETGLFGGGRISKADARVEAYGAVDELNALIGVARAHAPMASFDDDLDAIQHDLFCLGADLASPVRTSAGQIAIERVSNEKTEALERTIDKYERQLDPLTQFILPGGHIAAAALHACRTVCRRAERRCVALMEGTGDLQEAVNPEIVKYLNRLSDLLFVLARYSNREHGVQDVAWKA